jgi:hypothetical protein
LREIRLARRGGATLIRHAALETREGRLGTKYGIVVLLCLSWSAAASAAGYHRALLVA